MDNKPKPVALDIFLVLLIIVNFLGVSAASIAQENQLSTEYRQISQDQQVSESKRELETKPELALAQAKVIEQKSIVKQAPDNQEDKVSVSTANKEEAVRVGQHTASNHLDAMSMILSLFMVLALIVVAALVLKRFQLIRPQSAQLKLVTSLHLSAKEKLVVVQVGEQQLLLGLSAQQINLLHKLDQILPNDQETTVDLSKNLSKAIGKYLNKGDSKSS